MEPGDDVTPLGGAKKLVIERLQNVLGDETYKLFCDKIDSFFTYIIGLEILYCCQTKVLNVIH